MADLLQRLQAALGTRFTFVREHGRGGMATVFLAEEHHPRRQVAIKVLDPGLASQIGQERFLREVDLSAKLSHPHIMPIFAAGEADGLLYFVMPFLAGETLRDRLEREGPLPAEEALRIAAEIADALGYAHRLAVVHRDIKPENILLLDGHAVVADFGVARATLEAGNMRLTRAGASVGTPLYMSPEQAAGHDEVDGRADIYALGCVVYEMLTGGPPFPGPTVEAVLAQHVSRTAPELPEGPGMPAGIAPIIAKALAKAPADRFATAGELARLLRGFVGPSAGWRPPFTTRRVRHAVWVIATAAAVALVAVVLLAQTLRRPHPASAGSSVAVLYFDNLSPDTADAYLADGLTEEIAARLGQVTRLTTKSRAAVRRFRGATDPASVGRQLHASYLVTGTLRRSTSRVRVGVELVAVATGDRIWGDQYDRADGDVLDIEQSIALAVAEAVVGRLMPGERALLARRSTQDRQAYDLFLRGNFDLARRTPQAVARAGSEYEAAASRDPRFSDALARAALVYEFFADWGWPMPGVAPESLLARGMALADSALALDSASSDAWMAYALLLSKREPRTYRGVVPAFQRAIALDSGNAEALQQYGSILRDLGQDSAAIAMSLRALTIEPNRAITLAQLGIIALVGRKFPEADRWLDSAVAVEPSFAFAYPFRSAVHAWLHDTAAARADAEMALRLGGSYRLPGEAALVVLDASVGRRAAARRRAANLETLLPNRLHPATRDGVYTAAALVTADEPDRALDMLERVHPRGAALWEALRAPWFDALRSNARFRRLVAESQPPPGS